MCTKQSNLGYADVFLNIACMHCLAGLGMLSLCVYYDLYGFTFNWWQRESVFSGVLDGGPHGVLEQLEEDVVEVRRDVDELDRVLAQVVLRADFADLE